MNRTLLLAICLVTLCAVLLPAGASAQEDQPLEASILFGVGGSFDSDESGLGNSGYQIGLSLGVAREANVRASLFIHRGSFRAFGKRSPGA